MPGEIHLGTYKTIKEVDLKTIVDLGIKYNIKNIDTAHLYHNENTLSKVLKTHHNVNFNVTTKMYTQKCTSMSKCLAQIEKSLAHFKDPKYNVTMLLHNPMPHVGWQSIEQFGNRLDAVGVSNHNISELEKIFKFCNYRPTVNQIEFHPYKNNRELVEFCKTNNIKVMAHSIFLQGRCLGDHTIIKIAGKYGLTSAQIIFMWCLSYDIDVCINTKNEKHLTDLLSVMDRKLDDSDIAEIDGIHERIHMELYNRDICYIPELKWCTEKDIRMYIDKMYKVITEDNKNMQNKKDISKMCKYIPSINNKKYTKLVDMLCGKFMITPKKLGRMANDLRFYERKMHSDYSNVKHINKGIGTSKCTLQRNIHTRELDFPSDDMVNPKPMPVDVTDYKELEPIFQYIGNNFKTKETTTFFKGTMFSDGRMDLCKQVVGPQSIETLCENVMNNSNIKHFLLGNNVAFDNNNIKGAEKMRDLMKHNDTIETYYLAGNCITPDCIKIMCEGLKDNKTCDALWLKRNPIGPNGSAYVGDLLNHNHTIRVLDFHNCGLMDEGLINFCNSITCDPNLFSLEYLYLDCNGLTAKSMKVFSEFIKKYNSLKSIFLSLNAIGNSGLRILCDGLRDCHSLEHLNIESCNISVLRPLGEVVKKDLNNLKVLSVGVNNNTVDVQGYLNFIDDDQYTVLSDVISFSPKMMLLHCRYSHMSELNKFSLLATCDKRNIVLDINISKTLNSNLSKYHSDDTLRKTIREIKHSNKAACIDSVYRGKQ
jgi:diketogulonate reductase-like aldo/keto reductase/Ran GTPase-activating protein (RanGAP) involved in mRNA processing and transport